MESKPLHIKHLLRLFMAGESTLAQERELARYFATHDVDADWAAYKEMFALFDRGLVEPAPARVVPLRRRWWWAAAVVALLAVATPLVYYATSTPPQTGIVPPPPIVEEVPMAPIIDTIAVDPQQAVPVATASRPHRKAAKRRSAPLDSAQLKRTEAQLEMAAQEYIATRMELRRNILRDRIESTLAQPVTDVQTSINYQ